MPTPANPGPLPIRSTGASVAIAGHAPAIAALQAADFVLDCTVEGLLHSPELGAVLGAGTRVLMISNEHPETFERMHHDSGLAERVARGKAMMQAASAMHVTSRAGTDLTVDLAGAFCAGSVGYTSEPGDIAHWPGGLVLAFPAARHGGRHARARARRREPHVQAVRAVAGATGDRARPHHGDRR